MNKKKRQSMVLSDSDSESENASLRSDSKKSATKAEPAKKKQKQHPETVFVESDGEDSAMPQSPASKGRKVGAQKQQASPTGGKKPATGKSPKAGQPVQKNTLDNYFSRLGGGGGGGASSQSAKTSSAAAAASAAGRAKVNPADFFTSPTGASKLTAAPSVGVRPASAAKPAPANSADQIIDDDPDIIEASFVDDSPRPSTSAKSKAGTPASKQAEQKPPAQKQQQAQRQRKPSVSEASPRKAESAAAAGGASASAEKSPMKRSATTPEAKRSSYLAYLHRDGPKHLGELRLPKAKPNSLGSMTVVITGVLDYIEKELVEALLHQCGAKVTKSVSKRTSMLVVGREPGASKLDKAKQAGVRCYSEKEFYAFLCDRLGQPAEADPDEDAVEMLGAEPGSGAGGNANGRSSKPRADEVDRSTGSVKPRLDEAERSTGSAKPRSDEAERSTGSAKPRSDEAERSAGSAKPRPDEAERSTGSAKPRPDEAEQSTGSAKPRPNEAERSTGSAKSRPNEAERSTGSAKPRSDEAERSTGSAKPRSDEAERSTGSAKPRPNEAERSTGSAKPRPDEAAEGQQQLMWVDKYKPRSLKQVIGQTGPASCASKLVAWLGSWHRHLVSGVKRGTAQPFQRFNNDGSALKAALLSGPPGIGKTTTATLACQELGYECLELNASDTRNKRSLHEIVGEALGTFSVGAMFGGGSGGGAEEGRRRCIIMDEVDGMAGNEDRGGVAELIQLIKASQVPIICICNDRNHMKMRSLANYCFDLRFQRPRPEQIRAAAMSIASREGLKVDAQALLDVISASNNDVRQTIHNLQAWTSNSSGGSTGADQLRKDAGRSRKDLRFGPFDLARKALSSDETAGKSINELADLFFQDYNMEPLFIQENYPQTEPDSLRSLPPGKRDLRRLQLLSQAADFIALGDICGRSVRSQGNWALLPTQALFSSVLPGKCVSGQFSGQVAFPAWLGRNSTAGKSARQLSLLACHLRLASGGLASRDLGLDLAEHLAVALTRPLRQSGADGVSGVVDVLEAYDLQREDMDSLLELTAWPGRADPLAGVDPRVKAALTRAYNKSAHLTPYSLVQAPAKRKAAAAAAADEFGEEAMLGDAEGDGDDEADGDGEDNEADPTMDAMIKKPKKAANAKAKSTAAAGAAGGSSKAAPSSKAPKAAAAAAPAKKKATKK